MGKFISYILSLIIAIILYSAYNSEVNAPITSVETPENQKMAELFNYNNLKDPEQSAYSNSDGGSISLLKNNSKVQVEPQANYRIYAMVMNKCRYYWGWQAEIGPYDLALGWNELMLPENQKGINYTQSNRWYYYQFDDTFPLAQSYIDTHSSNHHIIPANTTVFKAIDKVRNKEKIYMEGYLVNLKGVVDNKEVTWNSSLSRNDTGDGACEVFYVKRVILDGIIYE